jgi:hypothetical protein
MQESHELHQPETNFCSHLAQYFPTICGMDLEYGLVVNAFIAVDNPFIIGRWVKFERRVPAAVLECGVWPLTLGA